MTEKKKRDVGTFRFSRALSDWHDANTGNLLVPGGMERQAEALDASARAARGDHMSAVHAYAWMDHAGFEWTQQEQDGYWECEAGYVQEGAPGVWFAFPNINVVTRLRLRGPYSSREQAMAVTADAFGTACPE